MLDIGLLAAECQQVVQTEVVRALIDVESNGNPLAVAVIGFDRFFQPSSLTMGNKMLNSLEKRGIKYSAGLMQITKDNFAAYELDNYSVFNPCVNIKVGADIYHSCLLRSIKQFGEQNITRNYKNAASCYFSGNFKTGYVLPKNKPYVERFEEKLNQWLLRNKKNEKH
ncbi:transglycosylase SLT domain-containing protein [Vibrio furnissii]|uniref:transglycosylase SLT domain-containing protein n=1 Tax=Vibrio furnissii TaxID=29494 RepID=UPI001C9D1B9A|nr:transglycosylase SLT domain-containing protein [Vibrio furnissii]MCG6230255.1 transglycosylase SLT domain-containing protein [Vibrio furnissii]MCG6268454.1 transglycosylase SLT domain-containing protein [Vibrio furnissii]